MAGHIGKFIKISAGIFNTHSKVGDARNEIMIANLALMGASTELVRKIMNLALQLRKLQKLYMKMELEKYTI